jgi:hypothetical protein
MLSGELERLNNNLNIRVNEHQTLMGEYNNAKNIIQQQKVETDRQRAEYERQRIEFERQINHLST